MTEPVPTAVIRYAIMPSAIGKLLIAAQDAGIIHVAFENHDFDRVSRLEAIVPVRTISSRYATTQFDEYFAGTRTFNCRCGGHF